MTFAITLGERTPTKRGMNSGGNDTMELYSSANVIIALTRNSNKQKDNTRLYNNSELNFQVIPI